MRYLWITVFALLITSCTGNANHRQFVATPVADEIREVIYSKETAAGTKTWKLTNDDLRVRLATQSRDGRIIAQQTKKVTPNDFNWVVYNLEKANFTKVRSLPSNRPAQANEVLTVVTQADVHTYTQNNSTRLPNGFQKAVYAIPGFLNTK